jgi:hypothetical protein
MREVSGRVRKVGSVLRLFSVVMLIAVLASVVGVGASAKPVQACACLDVNIVAPDRFPVGSPFAVSAIIWNRCDCIADNVKGTIHLPPGLELVWPEKDIMYGRIWPHTCLAYCWLVRETNAAPPIILGGLAQQAAGDYCIRVTALGKACGDSVIGSDQHVITLWDWR